MSFRFVETTKNYGNQVSAEVTEARERLKELLLLAQTCACMVIESLASSLPKDKMINTTLKSPGETKFCEMNHKKIPVSELPNFDSYKPPITVHVDNLLFSFEGSFDSKSGKTTYYYARPTNPDELLQVKVDSTGNYVAQILLPDTENQVKK